MALKGKFCLERSSLPVRLSIPSAALLFFCAEGCLFRVKTAKGGFGVLSGMCCTCFSSPRTREGIVPCAGFHLPADGSSASAQRGRAGSSGRPGQAGRAGTGSSACSLASSLCCSDHIAPNIATWGYNTASCCLSANRPLLLAK